jgi:hypothetical protein
MRTRDDPMSPRPQEDFKMTVRDTSRPFMRVSRISRSRFCTAILSVVTDYLAVTDKMVVDLAFGKAIR